MSGCEGYDAIARVYDKLNKEIDYKLWADFFEKSFERYLPERPELVLDLACGTGRMTRELSSRGYDMIGVDGSADMLSEAYSQNEEGKILYLLQDMRSFELYGTVGAVVCCLDSLNYLLDEGDLKKTFDGVHNYLDPDGLFIFDMNTPYKFENIYGENAYVYDVDEENGGSFCIWQNFYDKDTRLCDFLLTVFKEDEGGCGKYTRHDEEQRERCYSMDEIEKALAENGFSLLGVYSDYDASPIKEDTHRWYFCARAIKNI